MNNISLSIIGSGYIARKVLKELSSLCQIVSIYSTNKKTSKEIADKYKIKCCYTYDEILNDENIDCIYIATPHSSHFYYAVRAIKSKKSVICEKPSTINGQQLNYLINLSETYNVYFGEIMHFRFTPVFNELKRIIDLRTYGKLKSVYASIGFDAYALPKRKRLLNPDTCGGSLLDIGIYLAAFAEFIFDNLSVNSYTIFSEKNDDGIDIENKINANINGVNCDFECSFKRILPTEINLFFEKGEITIPYFFRPSKLIFSDDNNIENIYCNSFSYKYQFEKAFKDISSGVIESEYYNHKSNYNTICLLDKIRYHENLFYSKKLESIDPNGE